MSTTPSPDQELTDMEAGGSGNNNNNFNTAITEHMFDKVLTPSDVGKLNRLVIPKQHAENHFPLEENQNGVLLDFQDRNGKVWRFRYSYWTSSQSYVMTKGWSRFVKDKKLEAADTVSFYRGHVTTVSTVADDQNQPENQRKIMFIDWKHRAADINLVRHNIDHHRYSTFPVANFYPVTEYSMPHYRSFPPFYHNHFQERELLGYGRYYAGSPLDHHHHHHQWNLGRSEPLVYDSYPVLPTARVTWSPAMLTPSPPLSQPPTEGMTTKKLRLFGVDVEESSSSGETRGEMGVAGNSLTSIRDDESSWRWPRGEMGSSVMQLSDDENYKRKGKSLEL